MRNPKLVTDLKSDIDRKISAYINLDKKFCHSLILHLGCPPLGHAELKVRIVSGFEEKRVGGGGYDGDIGPFLCSFTSF